jgi:hypothetical protein
VSVKRRHYRNDVQTTYWCSVQARCLKLVRRVTDAKRSKALHVKRRFRVRGYLKYRANIPPRWIKNARGSRKRIEPEIAEGFRSLKHLRIRRPRAKVAIRNAQRELRSVLDRWETAYRKENFYRGIRILLELQRDGSSML